MTRCRIPGLAMAALILVMAGYCPGEEPSPELPVPALKDLIAWAHDRQLEFHVTEASVWLKKGRTPAALAAQAATYRAILKTLLDSRKGGVVAWNTWHVTDARGWHIERLPSLFDADYRAKPAYFAI